MTDENDRETYVKALRAGLNRASPANLLVSATKHLNDMVLFRGARKQGWGGSCEIPFGSRVFVVAIGKASIHMVRGLKKVLLGSSIRILKGSVIISNLDTDASRTPSGFEILKGSHPFPGEVDRRNTEKLLERLSGIDKKTVVLFLVSGGASSMLFKPRAAIPPELYLHVVKRIMLGGGSIEELNTVRTFLSDVKGGGVTRELTGNSIVSLVLSDVMDDDPRFIGSGPTFPWEPDPATVQTIMERYDIEHDVVESVKIADPRSLHLDAEPTNILIGSNDSVLCTISSEFIGIGFKVHVESKKFRGEARRTGQKLLHLAREALDRTGCEAFIQGGETTVNVLGTGRGGRNSEMASSLVPHLREGETVICLATDGRDGDWEGAGIIVDRNTDSNGLADSLENNDTGSYALRTNTAIVTGDTGNNLGDIFILLRSPPRGPPLRRRRAEPSGRYFQVPFRSSH